jgi:hypothetical protein
VCKGASCRSLALFVAVVSAGLFAGCGGGTVSPSGPTPGENTTVVVLLTSTANDQLSYFGANINNLQLVNASGQAVAVYSYNNQPTQPAEFMHLNGAAEPLVITTVPQDTYTSAIISVERCVFGTVTYGPPSPGAQSDLNIAYYNEGVCNQGTGEATVNLPSPITISGNAMALSLNLQVSQSYTLSGAGTNNMTYAISPVFTLRPLAISSQPTNYVNGKISGVEVQITSVNTATSTFAANTISGVSLSISSDNNTVFQGLGGLGSFSVGELVNTDLVIQPDGSLRASRVEVNDPSAPGEFTGPWLSYSDTPNVFTMQPFTCFSILHSLCDSAIHVTSTTAFGVSGQVTNLQNLPFVANFNASEFVLGANFSSFSSGSRDTQGIPYATTVTLEPQTINGTVASMSSVNGFSVYTVTLASYDLIPTLQQSRVAGSPNELAIPSSVLVYADSNTQLLNSAGISTGSLLRFRGVILNNNGTASMDCQAIMDGVTE